MMYAVPFVSCSWPCDSYAVHGLKNVKQVDVELLSELGQ